MSSLPCWEHWALFENVLCGSKIEQEVNAIVSVNNWVSSRKKKKTFFSVFFFFFFLEEKVFFVWKDTINLTSRAKTENIPIYVLLPHPTFLGLLVLKLAHG